MGHSEDAWATVPAACALRTTQSQQVPHLKI
jgi:hypothetical protein